MYDFDNLPGVISQVKDYNLGTIQDDSNAATESVLILGTAIDGPTGIPMPLSSISAGKAIFGDFKDATGNPNGASLIRGAQEAYGNGSRNVRVMRVSGKKAKVVASLTGTTNYKLAIEGRFEGAVYNSVKVTFNHTDKSVTISKPASKMTDYERTMNVGASAADSVLVKVSYADYNLSETSALADIIKAVNKFPNNNVVSLKIVDLNGSDLTNSLDTNIRSIKISAVPTTEQALVGGDDEIGLSSIELYRRLGGYVTKFVATAPAGGGPVTVSAGVTVPTTSISGYENAIYDILANYKVDNIVLMDASADADLWPFKSSDGKPKSPVAADFGTVAAGSSKEIFLTTDNFARQLAQACAVISARSNECIGQIGTTVSVGSDLLSVKNHVNKLLGKSSDVDVVKHASVTYDLYLKNTAGQKVYGTDQRPVDIGGYISIVAAPDLAFGDDTLGLYASNGVAAYAGLVSALKAEFSSTNRKVVSAIGLRYELSATQLSELTGAGYVTFRSSFDQGVVVTDGITAAGPMSDFQRLTTKRITKAVMNVVRGVCEPFIGMPNNLPQRNAITTSIQAGLDAMKQAGAIQDAHFEFYSSKKDQRLGNALIDLTIVPVFEFRKIRVYVNLKNPV